MNVKNVNGVGYSITYGGQIENVPNTDGGVLVADVAGMQYKGAYESGDARFREWAEYDLRRWVALVEQLRAYRRLKNRGEPLLTTLANTLADIERVDGPEFL